MEYPLEKHGNKGSLLSDFRQWEQLEHYLTGQVSKKDLESRRFRRMKLKEYKRLLRAYSGSPLTRDERGLVAVMKFQQGSLVRSLYPGLLSRLFYHIGNSAAKMLLYNRELARARLAEDRRIISIRPKLPESAHAMQQQMPAAQRPDENLSKKYGPDLGGRNQAPNQQRPGGPSI